MSLSLESALRTCKVDTAWASRIESDRFLNPNNMVCPVWNGMDTAGREVCQDSFNTKRGGCNSATDRVEVENNVSRPQYMEYITLSANGIAGNIYGNNMPKDVYDRDSDMKSRSNIAGNFGLQFGSNIQTSCGGYDSYKNYGDKIQGISSGYDVASGFGGSSGASGYRGEFGYGGAPSYGIAPNYGGAPSYDGSSGYGGSSGAYNGQNMRYAEMGNQERM